MIKPQYELIPPEAIESLAEILTLNLDKHGNRWEREPMKWGDHFGAAMRHLWKWWSPFYSDLDDETGRSHLNHALARIAFLIAYEKRGIGENNKPIDQTHFEALVK